MKNRTNIFLLVIFFSSRLWSRKYENRKIFWRIPNTLEIISFPFNAFTTLFRINFQVAQQTENEWKWLTKTLKTYRSSYIARGLTSSIHSPHFIIFSIVFFFISLIYARITTNLVNFSLWEKKFFSISFLFLFLFIFVIMNWCPCSGANKISVCPKREKKR